MAESENLELATQARMAAAALALGGPLAVATLACSLLAITVLLLQPLPGTGRLALLASCGWGLVGAYYALRTGFDQRLFTAWSQRWEAHPDLLPDTDLAALDHFIGRTQHHSSKPLAERMQGALTLLQRQILALTLQFITLLATAWYWPSQTP